LILVNRPDGPEHAALFLTPRLPPGPMVIGVHGTDNRGPSEDTSQAMMALPRDLSGRQGWKRRGGMGKR
jgi:hypothetical protein